MARHGGTPDGFEEAFAGLWAIAYRAASRLLGGGAEAEDVAAEALARALVRWRRVGELDHRDAWVARVAANVAVDTLRRRGRRIPARTEPTGLGPEDATVARLVVSEALTGLPRRQREVLALRHLLDLSEAEVSAALGISANSVKKHAGRGMAALRLAAGPMEEDTVAG